SRAHEILSVHSHTPRGAVLFVVLSVPTRRSSALDPPALLIVATAVLDELQVTWVVRSCVVLSLKVPVAVNCRVVPFAMLGFVGVTAIEERVAFVTVSVVFPETSPSVAVIAVVLAATEIGRPSCRETVRIFGIDVAG